MDLDNVRDEDLFLIPLCTALLRLHKCLISRLSIGPCTECVCRPCCHDPRGAVPEHHSVHQLLGFSVEEELAKRPGTLHQEFYGTFRKDLLNAKSVCV